MTNVVRWNPFTEVDRLFNHLATHSSASWPRFTWSHDGAKLDWTPSADISETDKEYLVRAELPAIRKEDIKVTIEGGMITIEGERKQEKQEHNEKFHRIESFYGSFSRSFSLPENVDSASIKCDSKDGLLTVHMPKKQAAKSSATEIKIQ